MPQPLPSDAFSTPASCAACRLSIRQGSHSFYLASQLLPVTVREPAYAIYAFCRMADDKIDREEGGPAAIDALDQMLGRIYAGRPGAHFVERCFADVVAQFSIPRALPQALVEGLAWDAMGRRYHTLDDLKDYAVRVAGTVGLMMTLVMGRRDPEVLARACDLGVAMQLTNIARDIGEDAANGRLYLPLSWLREAGIEERTWLAAPDYRMPVRAVVERLLDEAELLYRRSETGIAGLPGSCRRGIDLARLLYREIGREIGRGIDPVTCRAVTSGRRKLALAIHAAVVRRPVPVPVRAPTVPAAVALIDAIAALPGERRAAVMPPWWDVVARSERMIGLLERFSQRELTDAEAPRG